MQTILAHYKSILEALRYSVDENDFISVLNPLGTASPAKSDGMRWVMPTMAKLCEGFSDDLQPFHPLSEQISRKGVSPVLQHMQRKLKAEIALVLMTVTGKLVEVTLDTESHKDIPLNISGFLKKLSSFDANTKNWYDKLMDAANKKHKLVTVYLKAGGKYKGIDVNRLTVVKFPFLEELKDESKEDVCGVAIPKKHRKTLVELFELVIPEGDKVETYSFGTNIRVAPYFVSFLHATHKILSQLNKVLEIYNGPLNMGLNSYPLFDLDIIESFDSLQDVIPPLNGNEGRVSSEEELAESNKNNNTVSAAVAMHNSVNEETKKPKAQPNQEVVKVALSQQVATNGAGSVDDWLNKMRGPQQQPNMAMYQQPVMPQYQQPQLGFQMGQQYQPQPTMQYNNGYGMSMQQPQVQTNAAGHVMLPWGNQQPQQMQQPMGFNLSSGNQGLARL